MRPLRLLALLVTLTATIAQAVPLPPDKEKWAALQAGEFLIYSNASERETREIAANLLRMREALGKVTRLNVRSPRPTYVFVFRNERSFAPYRDAIFGRKNASVSGGFLPGRLANFIVMDAMTRAGADRVIYHELTHYFIRNTTAGVPLWLDEGLAEYYSTFSVSGEKVSIGRPVHEHVQWLRAQPLIPLAQHFAVGHGSPEYSETTRKGSFYAQSWALVHYLLGGDGTRRQQLAKFLAELRAGKSNEDAFRAAFGSDYAALEEALRAYVRRPAMPYVNYTLDELTVPGLAELRPVARDELLYALGSLFAWNRGTQAEGEALLTEAIRLNPEHAEAHATLASLREAQGDREGATALYEKAIALGSRDPMVYLIYGQTLLERTGTAAETTQRARQLFERAVQLDPNDARAWAGVGMTYVGADGDLTPGITALEKSLSLAASQEETAVNLIQLYANAGRREDAQRLHDTILAPSSNPQYVRIAREAVLFADLRAAERLFNSGKQAEAVALLRPILAKTTDGELRQRLQSVITEYEEAQQSQAVRDIVHHASAGRTRAALALLDALLPHVKDAELRTQLTEMRKDLTKRVK